MRKTLLAATLLAAVGGFVATGAAYADDFSGVGQHPRQTTVTGATAPAASEMLLPEVRTPVQHSPFGGAFDPSDVTVKSHGHT